MLGTSLDIMNDLRAIYVRGSGHALPVARSFGGGIPHLQKHALHRLSGSNTVRPTQSFETAGSAFDNDSPDCVRLVDLTPTGRSGIHRF